MFSGKGEQNISILTNVLSFDITMSIKLLVILFIINLYAQINTFSDVIFFL